MIKDAGGLLTVDRIRTLVPALRKVVDNRPLELHSHCLTGLAPLVYLEGAKHNIRVNTLAPIAGTRMTEDLFPPEAFKAFAPENVVPAALYLVSEDAPSNAIVGAGAGVVQASYVTLTKGVLLPEGERTPEAVAARWSEITDRTGEIVPASGSEQSMSVLKLLQGG